MPETIVVTLRTDQGFCQDFELPATVPLAELYPRLLAVLQQISHSFFSWKGLFLETEQGVLLDPDATLYDYGICSGYDLSVIQGENMDA